MTRMATSMRSDEVVGIDIPNLTDVEDLLSDHVQNKYLLKNLEYGIGKELLIGPSKGYRLRCRCRQRIFERCEAR